MTDLSMLFNKNLDGSTLKTEYEALIVNEPKKRRKELAVALGVPEAALIDQCCGVKSIRLSNRFSDMIYVLPELGYIMTLTRNEFAVHERKGIYDNIKVTGPMGLVISPDKKIDLRIILSKWAYGFAVEESTGMGSRYSLQFFDKTGMAIQKIFLQPDSHFSAYRDFVSSFKAGDDVQPLMFSDEQVKPDYVSDGQVDREGLLKEWQGMKDVHQFHGMLRRYQIAREQAYRLVGNPYAFEIDPALLEDVLQQAAGSELSIMCFVGNPGNIQIHTGVIHQVKRMGAWLNVLDPEFNLHLLEEGIVSGWLVRKPTKDGWVTSLEFYSSEGDLIVQFFGERMEGNPESEHWRQLAESTLAHEAVA